MIRHTATPHWVDVPPGGEYPPPRRTVVDEWSKAEPDPIPDRYTLLGVGDDEVVIYDREDTDAWIQSNRAVPLTAPGAGGVTDG